MMTAQGVQLCAQQAQRHSDGDSLGSIQSTDHGDYATTHGSSGFIPNNGAASTRKGQEHRLNRSGNLHCSRNIAKNDAAEKTGAKRSQEDVDCAIEDVPLGEPIIQS